jgi:uncharacterized protein (DUF362 family)
MAGEGPIVVSYGRDIFKTAYDALKESDIGLYLNAEQTAAIKPNLVVARPASGGATTHPEVVEAIIVFLKEAGVKKIKIIESSWVGDSTRRAFKNCGYEELAKRHNVPLIDLKADSHTTLSHGKYRIEVCDEALNAGFLINVPVLKAHCQTRFTCCMKNLKGCIPDSEKRRFHSLGIHKPVAVLNKLLRTGYNVVDGICGDLTVEEGGTPVEANRLIAGRDPLTVDSYCAGLIGYRPDEIEYITYGAELGVGKPYSSETRLTVLNAEQKPVNTASGKRLGERYRGIIHEDAACSACYSALMYALHRNGGAKTQIHIGQGFKGKNGGGTGIGNCACGFTKNVPGCPPKAVDILNALNG